MITDFAKRINDPIHGTIGLTGVEMDVISSPTFQRLHNVKQLGLGALVYPSANYSRFSHSVGACHVIGQMLGAIEKNAKHPLSDAECQRYRLAALLHDVGHFPFSHTFEHAIRDFYVEEALTTADAKTSPEGDVVYNHETMGRELLKTDKSLTTVFKKYGMEPDEIIDILASQLPEAPLTATISSDLDCDRLDYLKRTAYHAGLPYGDIDIGYIISQMTLDKEQRPCLEKRAIRAADHFLISRYFDYTQVAYHHTVVALELALEHVIKRLLEDGYLNCSADAMRTRVGDGNWSTFDDQYLTEVMRKSLSELGKKEDDVILRSFLRSVLERRPPKLVLVGDLIENHDYEKKGFRGQVRHIREKIPGWAAEFGVNERLWNVWEKTLSLTKVGASIPFEDADDLTDDEFSQLVRIKGLDAKNPDCARPLISLTSTVVHTLSTKKFFGLRVYVNLSEDEKADETSKKIAAKLRADMPHIGD